MNREETRTAIDCAGVLMTLFGLIMVIAGACGAPVPINGWTAVFFSIVLFFVTVKIVYICKAPG